MRLNFLIGVTLLSSLSVGRLSAADSADTPRFVLPEVGQAASVSRFTPAEIAHVSAWIRREAPECPEVAQAAAAAGFLEELRRRYPDQADRLLAADFPAAAHVSMLLRHVGANLSGAAPAGLREKLALRRMALLLGPAEGEATGLLAKIRESSQVQHRRVLEGRLEDDEMRSLMDKTRQPPAERKAVQPAEPVELTANDIVSEFSRRNQTAAAVSRLQAYTLDGRLTDAAGEVSELLLHKMRPDRFRLVVRRGNVIRSIMAGDGDRFWMQSPGQPARLIAPQAMGERRFMGEFIDPLFVGDGYTFERLADKTEGDRKVYRLAVRRRDGSGYVAHIDPETFQETGRENTDRSVLRYTDHRETAGLTLAFHEELTDAQGGKSTFVLTRITPNPGLIREFFQPPVSNQPSLLDLERAMGSDLSTGATLTSK